MAKVNSKGKGARGERELRDILIAHGFEARRGRQYSGKAEDGSEHPDVYSNTGLHWEAKRCETTCLPQWIKQASADSERVGKPWVIAHKRNRSPWLATLDLETFLNILNGLHHEEIRNSKD